MENYDVKSVGIIIPVYNGKKYICQTIQSCLNQEYENVEILIIDDCSTDDSYVVINEFIKSYSGHKKINIFKNEKNIGVLGSCNKAAGMLETYWIIFLGQDDLLPLNYIKNIILKTTLSNSFAFCNPMKIDKDGNEIGLCRHDDSILHDKRTMYRELSKECIIASTGLMINHKLFDSVNGFNTQYRNYGEWNLWIRLIKTGECVYIDSEHSLYRRHDTNMTNSFVQKSKMKELQKYWNSCRRLAQKELLTSFIDLLDSKIYYIKANALYWVKKVIGR